MEIVILIMLWELSLVGAFLSGKKYGNKKKAPKVKATASEESKKSIERIKKEYANFMNYDGSEQDAINDFE